MVFTFSPTVYVYSAGVPLLQETASANVYTITVLFLAHCIGHWCKHPLTPDAEILLGLTPFYDLICVMFSGVKVELIQVIIRFLSAIHGNNYEVSYGTSMFGWSMRMKEVSRQCNRMKQIISVAPNCTEDSLFRGDALPLSDSSEYSPKFYTSPPTSQSSSIPNRIKSPAHIVHGTQCDDDLSVDEGHGTDRRRRNTDSNSSSSTVCTGGSGGFSSSFGRQQSFSSACNPNTEVDELANQSGIQGQTESLGNLRNKPFVSQAEKDVSSGTHNRTVSSSVVLTGKNGTTSGYGNLASGSSVSTVQNGAGCTEQLHRTSQALAECTNDRELHGDEGTVKQASHKLYPVQEAAPPHSSDIVVLVPAVPNWAGLVIGSDS